MDGQLLSQWSRDLFDSGLFSDAQVKAGDKVWRVHRNILCTRSVYFEKAFAGHFKESQTGMLEIHDQDPDDVERVLVFLYTGEVDSTLRFKQLLELYKSGDYFNIDTLQTEVSFIIDSSLEKFGDAITNSADNHFPGREFMKSKICSTKLDEFLSAARIVYNDSGTFANFRKCIDRFLEKTCAFLGADPRFIRALEDLPALAVTMVKIMMDTKTQGARRMVCSMKPLKCEDCGDRYTKYWARRWITQDRGIHKVTAHGLCNKCSLGEKEEEDDSGDGDSDDSRSTTHGETSD